MKLFHLFTLFGVILGISACQNNPSKDDVKSKTDDITIDLDNTHERTVKKIFFNLPSPIELTQTLLASDNPYNNDLLNPVENLKTYETSSKLAMNFGVYGADLCYCRVYDQLQQSISYLATIRKITEKLQIPESEGSETINRIEENIANSDSIFKIIADTYAGADGYLKENDRDLTATFILVGGWVEGMYFAVEINNTAENKNELDLKIAEQKFSMENLMMLINEYKDNSTIAEFHPYFQRLSEIFENISISYDKAVVVTDQETKVTTIDNSTNIDISQKQIDEIHKLIGEIRSKIIS
ncbi:MAG: hypothetical protein PF517_06920 [Salinivirgaceae bacterium]|jgi:hypothetical protein|nr:hypothetical protein [Salinivirgaceae bacterium]